MFNLLCRREKDAVKCLEERLKENLSTPFKTNIFAKTMPYFYPFSDDLYVFCRFLFLDMDVNYGSCHTWLCITSFHPAEFTISIGFLVQVCSCILRDFTGRLDGVTFVHDSHFFTAAFSFSVWWKFVAEALLSGRRYGNVHGIFIVVICWLLFP